MLEARSGLAGMRARLAMRGRHTAELTHDLGRAVRTSLSRRERQYQRLRLTLETFDLRRRLAGVRTRLVSGESKLAAVMDRHRHGFESHLGAVAAKLQSLSPLAVLARGYAVCWNGDRTAVIRDAESVAAGDSVTVTLERGELSCEVKDRRP